jgi:hypothetical protein
VGLGTTFRRNNSQMKDPKKEKTGKTRDKTGLLKISVYSDET